jgi:Spy/CpxP family protein refolding chaperone
MKALRPLILVVLSTATAWLTMTPSGATAQSPRSMVTGQPFAPYVANGDTTYGLSQREGQRLLAGRGMGLARPAEMNGYPGPMHVLDLADELALTPEQQQQARTTRERVMTEAPALGRQIVEKELTLDRIFRDGSADEARVRTLTREIAQLRAELRALHLQAHLVMQRALAVDQVRTYMEARGHPMPARLRPDTP